MIVSIWGYTPDKKWNVIVVDFSKVIVEKCELKFFQFHLNNRSKIYRLQAQKLIIKNLDHTNKTIRMAVIWERKGSLKN